MQGSQLDCRWAAPKYGQLVDTVGGLALSAASVTEYAYGEFTYARRGVVKKVGGQANLPLRACIVLRRAPSPAPPPPPTFNLLPTQPWPMLAVQLAHALTSTENLPRMSHSLYAKPSNQSSAYTVSCPKYQPYVFAAVAGFRLLLSPPPHHPALPARAPGHVGLRQPLAAWEGGGQQGAGGVTRE